MKLCILGNSHTGSLKRAWDNLIEPSLKGQFEITFFAARGENLNGLVLDGTTLVPNNKRLTETIKFTSNGLAIVECNSYDVFLIYGAGIEPYFIDNSFHSTEALKCSIQDMYSDDVLGYKLLTMIRKVTKAKIFLGHAPLTSISKINETRDSLWKPEHYTSGVELVNQTLLRDLDVELIKQPKEACTENYRHTKYEYTKGSKRLAINNNTNEDWHPEHDMGHMNDEFGKIWLDSFLSYLNHSSNC
jgi:hypothetical protein